MARHALTQAGPAASVMELVHGDHVRHIAGCQGQRIVAAAGKVNALHTVNTCTTAGDRGIGDKTQVKRHTRAAQGQCVDAATAVHAGQLAHIAAAAKGAFQGSSHRLVNGKSIVARATMQHAGSGCGEAVVSRSRHQGFGSAVVGQGIGARSTHLVYCRLVERTASVAENNVAAPRIGAGLRIAVRRADDQVGQAVTVHIARCAHASAAVVIPALSVDDKAAAACRHGREFDGGSRGFAIHHITAPGIGARYRVAVHGPYEQVGQAIAIDITRACDDIAAHVVRALPVDHKPAAARCHGRQIDVCPGVFAKHYIAASCTVPGRRISQESPDDQVGQAISIDIPRAGHADAAVITLALPVDHKTTRATRHGRQVNTRARGFAVHHIASTGICSRSRLA